MATVGGEIKKCFSGLRMRVVCRGEGMSREADDERSSRRAGGAGKAEKQESRRAGGAGEQEKQRSRKQESRG